MAVGVYSWSTTANSNGAADANINYAEGQSPASLNNSARAQMAALRGWFDALGGNITYGGAADAYTATHNAVAAWSAYAAGQIVMLVPGATNTGASTLNVDGLGTKAICKGASTAVAAGDIVQNVPVLLRYDGTRFQIIGGASAQYQPLDATLTALAALSWSSGNPVVQFTAADTVSLTLTPSVSSITASQGAATTTPTAKFVNTTDATAGLVASFETDRATPTTSDYGLIDYKLSNSAGTQTAFGRFLWIGTDITAGSEDSYLLFYAMLNGVLTAAIRIGPNYVNPHTNDGVSLGASSAGFSDLFLASGGVINWNNGTCTLTQSSATLTASGAVQANMAASSETSGTLTSASRDTVINCSGGVTLPNSVFGEGQWQLLKAGSASRTITRGSGIAMYVNGTDSASATLSARGLAFVYWEGASTCYLTGDVV